MHVSRKVFGTYEGKEVGLWTLENDGPGPVSSVSCIEYGAALQSVRWGLDEILLGHDSLEPYLGQPYYLGALCGRYANRIAGGSFQLDETIYGTTINNGSNTLHGGEANFSVQMWDAEALVDPDDQWTGVAFSRISPDGEEGFPGNLTVRVEYYLTRQGDFIQIYEATSDRDTVVNLTSHGYWNLAGEDSGSIYDHVLRVPANHYVDSDDQGIPTGVLALVDCGNAAMDLRKPVRLGDLIGMREAVPGLEMSPLITPGIDHCYVIDTEGARVRNMGSLGALGERLEALKLHLGAVLHNPSGNRTMEVYTSYPGIQVYTANFLMGEPGRGGSPQVRHGAVCLETQYFPDAPNQPAFPQARLNAGESYRHATVHRFTGR